MGGGPSIDPDCKTVFCSVFTNFQVYFLIFNTWAWWPFKIHFLFYTGFSKSNTFKYKKYNNKLIKIINLGAKNGPAEWNGLKASKGALRPQVPGVELALQCGDPSAPSCIVAPTAAFLHGRPRPSVNGKVEKFPKVRPFPDLRKRSPPDLQSAQAAGKPRVEVQFNSTSIQFFISLHRSIQYVLFFKLSMSSINCIYNLVVFG